MAFLVCVCNSYSMIWQHITNIIKYFQYPMHFCKHYIFKVKEMRSRRREEKTFSENMAVRKRFRNRIIKNSCFNCLRRIWHWYKNGSRAGFPLKIKFKKWRLLPDHWYYDPKSLEFTRTAEFLVPYRGKRNKMLWESKLQDTGRLWYKQTHVQDTGMTATLLNT